MGKTDWDSGQRSFESVLTKYDRYLKSRDLGDVTIRRYIRDLSRFLEFAKEAHPDAQQADEFRDHLIERHQSASSVNTACCALKQFYAMYGEKFDYKALRVRNNIPYYFTEEEIYRIFEAIKNIKHLAMFQLLFYGCLRATELCLIEDKDLDLKNLTVRVHGKGRKEGKYT